MSSVEEVLSFTNIQFFVRLYLASVRLIVVFRCKCEGVVMPVHCLLVTCEIGCSDGQAECKSAHLAGSFDTLLCLFHRFSPLRHVFVGVFPRRKQCLEEVKTFFFGLDYDDRRVRRKVGMFRLSRAFTESVTYHFVIIAVESLNHWAE